MKNSTQKIQWWWLSGQATLNPPGRVELGDGLWFDANNLNSLTLSGSQVQSWSSAGGQTFTATPQAGEEPLLVDNQINDLPIVRFDGTEALSGALSVPFTPREGFVVVKHNRTGVFDRIFAFGTGTTTLLEYISSSVDDEAYKIQNNNSSEQLFQSSIALNQEEFNILGVVLQITLDGSVTSQQRFNTEVVASQNSITPTIADVFNIAQNQTGGGKGQYDIAEIIIYDRVLTNSERSSVQNYIINKYFPTAILTPSGSPLLDPNKNIVLMP